MAETAVADNNTETSTDNMSYKAKIWRRFLRHKIGIIGAIILIIMYLSVLFGGFIAPYDMMEKNSDYIYAPPNRMHFFDEEGNFHLRPFVYKLEKGRDPVTFAVEYKINKEKKYPLHFFVYVD